MFVWFMLENHRGEAWRSGIVHRPAFRAPRSAARRFDPRNARVELSPRAARHMIRIPARELRFQLRAGTWVGIRYALSACGRTLQRAAYLSPIGVDGWIPVTVPFRLPVGVPYRLGIVAEDVHGVWVHRVVRLLGGPSGSCGAAAG